MRAGRSAPIVFVWKVGAWMYAITVFLVVGLMSLLITRGATGALIATGMPPEIAAFQARSAFTGAGFTTGEAENVVNHPARRQVVSWTMFVGNLGVPTLVVTVLVGLLAPGPGTTPDRVLELVIGLAVLAVLAFTPPVSRFFVWLGQRTIGPVLERAFSGAPQQLLQLGDDYRVATVELSHKLPIRSIRGLQQALPDVTVLGVRPKGQPGVFVTGPPVDIELKSGDAVVVLADQESLDSLTVHSG
jgi:hypothetical protein